MPVQPLRLLTCCSLLVAIAFLSLGQASTSSAQNRPPTTSQERLRAEVEEMLEELQSLRAQLAQAEIRASSAERELAEMQQFIRDHDVYGDAFEEYKAIKEIAEREDRRREAEAVRARREAERQARQERVQQARQERQREREDAATARRLREAGFTGIGMDVFISRTAYHYATRDDVRTRVRFDPFIGFFTSVDRRDQIDFSEMTISGSVLNASEETKNIGVAITFFDENNNQVGAETIQVNNARPGVPYPFTAKINMALNREFSSSTSYVLYADPVQGGE